jgi:hypothetical protein
MVRFRIIENAEREWQLFPMTLTRRPDKDPDRQAWVYQD